MELEINQAFAKHYNEYRSKEEAAKTKKKLTKEIKEIEQASSSSSDSESDHDYQNTYVEQCDKLLRELDSKGINVLTNPPAWINDLNFDKTTVKVEKPIFAKDLNRKILLDGGIENELELQQIEKISKIDSDYIINKCRKPIDIIEDLEHVSDDENFFKPSSKPNKFVIKNTEKDNDEEEETNITDNDGDEDESIELSDPSNILINHDRKLKSVRVSKTKTRAEKRQTKKERKEKELKEKMKRLQDIKTKGLLEKIDRIKKVVPQAAEHLILDNLDEDFDIDEISKKLTEFFEKEDASLPVDKEKPVFSDDSDIDNLGNFDNDENDYSGEEKDNNDKKAEKPAVEKSRKSKKSEKSIDKTKSKSTFFTNLEILENTIKKKTGIIKKNQEIFDPEKHVKFSKYLKKNFDFCCEDLILGKDDADDILCKFKFREVEKQDYGLDTEEIILADPKELNKWASLKKITRIRTKVEEDKDRIRYEKRKNKKAEILKSVYCSDPEENDEEHEEQKLEVEKTDDKVLSKASKKRLRKTQKKRKLKEMLLENDADNLINEVEEPVLKKSKKNSDDVENTQELPVKKSKKKQDGECEIKKEELTKSEKRTKKRHEEMENISEMESSNKRSKIDGGNISDSNIKVKKEKSKTQCDVNKEIIQENADSSLVDEEHAHKTSSRHKKYKNPKKDKNSTSTNFDKEYLKSLGIKTDYYKYVLKKGNKQL